MSYQKLKGRIIEKFGSQEQFASHLSISNQTLSKKMNGRSGFSQADMIKWCRALDIDIKDVGLYFFWDKSSKI